MSQDLHEFYTELREDIGLAAGVAGNYKLAAFTELAADHLIDAGEFAAFDEAYHAQRGIEVHGSAGDPRDSDGVLSLVVAVWDDSPELATLGKQEVDASFRRLKGFLRASMGTTWHSWEESGVGYGLAALIHDRRTQLKGVRLYLVSNKKLSSRIRDFVDDQIDGIPIYHRIWDIERLKQLIDSGREREEMVIDLEDRFGRTLPCLPAHYGDADHRAFLAVVPGEMLAQLYEEWGTRLLEQNVRVFLQARGKVNQGIRDTIKNEPSMFFAYNNGITATAEDVETVDRDGSIYIRTLRNLQIVNGGQTTASIFTTGRGRDASDLSRVFVQMKLSVVPPEDVPVVVPNISRFANSQNTVKAADFFSNHLYHVRLEEASRRTVTPMSGTQVHSTRWFYERARGQYQDARARNKAGAERRTFDREFPRSQVFTKTDLAKFSNVWRLIPHIVSRGAQKNFAEFAEYIDEAWGKNASDFSDLYFRETIAKAIVFRQLEKLISKQQWYEGGYRANVVAYAIARLAHAVKEEKKVVNFEAIWKLQSMTEAIESMLLEVAERMHRVLLSPPEGVRNISEYAKREVCWKVARGTPIELSARFRRELVDPARIRDNRNSARRDQQDLDEIEALTAVVEFKNRDPHFWRKVRRFGTSNSLLTPKDLEIMRKAVLERNSVPIGKQGTYLLKLLERLRGAGFRE